MKIKFLGTKANIEESSKKHKYNSSLLIEYKNFKLLIDYGLLHKNKLDEIKAKTGNFRINSSSRKSQIKPNAIIITHAHPDHYIWTEENVNTNIPVYIAEETLKYGKFKPKNYKIIKPGKKFKIKNFTILPFRVLHSIRCPAIGFKISVNKKSIIYTGDLVDIVSKNKILKNVDYYIGDGSCIRANLVRKKGDKIFGHARISTQINWCKKCGIKNIIFTHLGKETIRKEKEFKKQNPKIVFAYDGMVKKIWV